MVLKVKKKKRNDVYVVKLARHSSRSDTENQSKSVRRRTCQRFLFFYPIFNAAFEREFGTKIKTR